MRRGLMCGIVVCGTLAPVSAQQLASGVTTPPVDQPKRLMVVQQLAWAAYPELQATGLQMRVETTATGTTVTFGLAEPDRKTVLAVSRPRAAELVVQATFDENDRLTRALLHGTLAHSKERREARALATGVAQALEEGGAAFPPSKRAAFLQQMNLKVVKSLSATLTTSDAAFQTGTTEEPLFWSVPATSASGEPLTLGFEPFGGRLVKFVRGGGQ